MLLQIRLTVESLPQLQGDNKYVCVFGDDKSAPETIGNASGSDITCLTPAKDLVPTIPANNGMLRLLLGCFIVFLEHEKGAIVEYIMVPRMLLQ